MLLNVINAFLGRNCLLAFFGFGAVSDAVSWVPGLSRMACGASSFFSWLTLGSFGASVLNLAVLDFLTGVGDDIGMCSCDSDGLVSFGVRGKVKECLAHVLELVCVTGAISVLSW